jgi:hypothetical protein
MTLPPLPRDAVEQIFEKLTLVYGVDFMNRYRGLEYDDVVADWARELAGFARNPDAIRFALENLPAGKPPTVLEFRDLARRVPRIAQALPPPAATPNVLQAELKRMDAIRRRAPVDPLAWARRLVARHEAGEKVRSLALKDAQAVLAKAARAGGAGEAACE